jgi:hypothetical protein
MSATPNAPEVTRTFIEAPGSSRRSSAWTLPTDLQAQAVHRLRQTAMLFAMAYFLAAWFPFMLSAAGRARFLSSPI